jgi:hypothetical protein
MTAPSKTEIEKVCAAFIETHSNSLAEFLHDDLKDETVGNLVEQEIERQLEERVAAGELQRFTGEDGEVSYRTIETRHHPK